MGVRIRTHGGNTNDPEVINIVEVAEQADGTFKVTGTREYVDTARFYKFGEALQKEVSGSA